ncbi:MAG: substrate-binding domain-containing protein, partial [Pseudomonadota bacterium]
RAGAVAEAARLGVPEMAMIDAGPAPVSMRHGLATVEAMGDAIRAFDALVCVSDPVAFGALSACRRLGVRVPDDIAITGFGNFEVAQVSEPRITTVDVGARRIGQEVARLLDALFAAEDVPGQIAVETRLIQGGTS